MSNKCALAVILKALFLNKLRFGDDASPRKKISTLVLIGVAVVAILSFMMMLVYYVGGSMAESGNAGGFYLIILLSGAAIVLIFGIVTLVSTLYLSRDTDFFSALPVKSSVVFAAKLLFVYISEAAITLIFILPAVIELGIVAHITYWFYYVISVLTLVIVPALPLAVAAIFAVPVMFLAGKFRNRSIVPLIFFAVLFLGFFALYFYLVFSLESLTKDLSLERLKNILNVIKVIEYILYPYTALSASALGVPMYGLSVGASIAVNLVIFVGSSAALMGILLLLGKFMYAQSAKANNQTDNSKSKKGSYKTAGTIKAMIGREYKLALRSTQVTVQCFLVYFLVILFAALFGYLYMGSSLFSLASSGAKDSEYFMALSILSLLLPTTATAAMTSFSREGVAAETLKILPITPKRIVAAKTAAWLAFSVPSAVIASVTLNAFDFEPARFFLSLFGFVLFTAAFNVFGVLWDLISPKLKWTDPMQAIKHNSHEIIGVLIGMTAGFVLLAVAAYALGSGIAPNTVYSVFWSVIYGFAAIFGIVDILLYRNVDKYFNRIEI